MAETRKSDFTGDVYGDWTVTGRAPAQNKKRAWHVASGDMTRVVLQTDLPDLANQQGAGAAVVQVDAGEGKVFDLVYTGTFFVDDPDSLPLDDFDDPQVATAGPGECQDGVPILECEKHSALLGEKGREAHEKYPQTFKGGSAAIVESVLNAQGKLVIDGAVVKDWTVDLPLAEALEAIEVDEDVPPAVGNGLGEFVDEGITEAALDALVPPQDPLRVAIRALMGLVFDQKKAIEALAAQVQVFYEDTNGLMAATDAVLREAVTR